MPTAATNTTVNQAFFQPLDGLAAKSLASKACPEFSDDDYLRLGVQRVLESSESGRAFLQEHGVRFENTPELGNYFSSLRSARRCEVLRDTNVRLVGTAKRCLHDRLADIPELANYECFAGDGHWHKAAAHDPSIRCGHRGPGAALPHLLPRHHGQGPPSHPIRSKRGGVFFVPRKVTIRDDAQ
jgi:hypothetical protein